MTQAPNRERERALAPGVTRRPPGERPQREGLDRASWNKAVMVLNVALIGGVAIVGLTYVRNAEAPANTSATDPPAAVASTLSDPSEPTTDPGAGETAAPPASPLPPSDPVPPSSTTEAPDVKASMRSNFARGDGWPVGAGFREAGALAWPLGVVDRLMTHGPARGPDAVSWLEKWTKTDVRTIGARVLFAPNHSGAAALTAWHTSILDLEGQQTPRTGMRLVVTPGMWRLVVIDGRGAETIATSDFSMDGRSARFALVRRGDTVWVEFPGGTTAVTDPRAVTLSGPWASWELREDKVGKRPAGFQEIWAG